MRAMLPRFATQAVGAWAGRALSATVLALALSPVPHAGAGELIDRVRIPERVVEGDRVAYATVMSPILAPSLPLMQIAQSGVLPTAITIGAAVGGVNNTVLYINGSGLVSSSIALAYSGAGATNILNVDHTGTLDAIQQALRVNFNPIGSVSNRSAIAVTLGAGYTGAFASAVNANVLTAGTGTNINANNAVSGTASGSGTTMTGGYFVGSGTATVGTVGVYGRGTPTSAVASVGGVFVGQNFDVASKGAAGLFLVDDGTGIVSTTDVFDWIPSGVKVGILASNRIFAYPLVNLYDNTTLVHTRQDGGSTWDKMGTKGLTLGGGAVAFAQVAVASGTAQGGFIDWCAEADDGTDFQTRCGILPFTVVNKAGTETCTVATPGTATESVAVSVGTFTVAFTTSTTPANACDFLANGASSLTETTMRINYHVRLAGNAATAVTPQ